MRYLVNCKSNHVLIYRMLRMHAHLGHLLITDSMLMFARVTIPILMEYDLFIILAHTLFPSPPNHPPKRKDSYTVHLTLSHNRNARLGSFRQKSHRQLHDNHLRFLRLSSNAFFSWCVCDISIMWHSQHMCQASP